MQMNASRSRTLLFHFSRATLLKYFHFSLLSKRIHQTSLLLGDIVYGKNCALNRSK